MIKHNENETWKINRKDVVPDSTIKELRAAHRKKFRFLQEEEKEEE